MLQHEVHFLVYASWGHFMKAVLLPLKGMVSLEVIYSQGLENCGAGSLQMPYVLLFQ